MAEALRGLVLTVGGERKRLFDEQALALQPEFEFEYIRGVNGRNVGQKAHRWHEELQPLFAALRLFKRDDMAKGNVGVTSSQYDDDWQLGDQEFERKFVELACRLKNEERPVLACLCK